MSIPSPHAVEDKTIRNAIIGLINNKPINTTEITDYNVRRAIQSLNKGTNAPSIDAISDYETKRILKAINNNRRT